jgi:hypothetical protein
MRIHTIRRVQVNSDASLHTAEVDARLRLRRRLVPEFLPRAVAPGNATAESSSPSK